MSLVRDYLIIHNTSTLLRVAASDILYIEADGNYCTIHLIDGSQEVVTHKLKEIQQMMEERFTNSVEIARVGRSLLVNLDYVYSINCTKGKLVLSSPDHTKTEKDLSADILKLLMQHFNDLIARDTADKNVRMIYERV